MQIENRTRSHTSTKKYLVVDEELLRDVDAEGGVAEVHDEGDLKDVRQDVLPVGRIPVIEKTFWGARSEARILRRQTTGVQYSIYV